MTILESETEIIKLVGQIEILDNYSIKLRDKVRALKVHQRNLNKFLDSAEHEWIKKDEVASELFNPENDIRCSTKIPKY